MTNGPCAQYCAVTGTALFVCKSKKKNDSNHRHWWHLLADDTTVAAGRRAPVMQRMARIITLSTLRFAILFFSN